MGILPGSIKSLRIRIRKRLSSIVRDALVDAAEDKQDDADCDASDRLW